MLDRWLPTGFEVASGTVLGRLVLADEHWQIYETADGGRALAADTFASERWLSSGCLRTGDFKRLTYGAAEYHVLASGPKQFLAPTDKCRAPHDKVEALAFATAVRETRNAGEGASLDGGIYVERLSRILPAREGHDADDAMVLGMWLSGGLRVPAIPAARLLAHLSWLGPTHLHRVVTAAGLTPEALVTLQQDASPAGQRRAASGSPQAGRFHLPGRFALEAFFNDHVVDVVQNPEHYRRLGLGNPPAIILEGPPGSGKTVAVERLLAFLGWPSFAVEAESIASPYIHETSRKVSNLFREAIDAAPSAIVIDEMDAFLSEREGGVGSNHRVEEIAEFLRRIPEAIKAGVLIIGMTNRIDVIDPAILRRGRFDHVIKVDYANAEEVLALLASVTADVPLASDVRLDAFAEHLAGRPLSDASFLVREAARLSARARSEEIGRDSFEAALASLLTMGSGPRKEPMGFVTRSGG